MIPLRVHLKLNQPQSITPQTTTHQSVYKRRERLTQHKIQLPHVTHILHAQIEKKKKKKMPVALNSDGDEIIFITVKGINQIWEFVKRLKIHTKPAVN